MAAEREARYAAEAEALAKEIPALARKADLDKGRADAVKKNSAQVIESVEAEMKLVEKFAGGTAGPGDAMAYNYFRMRANNELNPASDASMALFNPGTSPASMQASAETRLGELRNMLRGANLDSNRAGMVEGDSESRLSLARQRRAAALGEVSGSQTEQQRAKEAEDAERRQEAIRQRYRNTIESDTIQGTRTDAERSILDATRAPALGPQTTAVEEKLDVLIMLQRDMNRTWAA